jgi:hypothetical protein
LKALHEQPSLNINRDDLFNTLNGIRTLLENAPQVNQKEITDKIQTIERKVDTIDTPGIFNDLNGITADVRGLVNRPTVSPNDLLKGLQGVHDNIDEIKRNPIIAADKPLLTQDHFDTKMVPFVEANAQLVDSEQNRHDQQRAIFDAVQNVHHGLEEVKMRPIFDHKPVTGLAQQIQVYNSDQQRKINAISSKLDAIVVDDGSLGNQVKGMRQEVKEALASNRQIDDAKFQEMGKKLEVVTKVATGAAIASGLTLAVYFGWKAIKGLFGKKKEKAQKIKRSVLDSRAVPSRLHARSWDVKNDMVSLSPSLNCNACQSIANIFR